MDWGIRMKDCYGIYGIWIDNELVYIGKTICSFWTRFQQHKSGVKNQGGDLYLGIKAAKKLGKIVEAKPILSFDLETKEYSDRDLSCMEYALIKVLKPKYNKEGRSRGFRF